MSWKSMAADVRLAESVTTSPLQEVAAVTSRVVVEDSFPSVTAG